VRIIANPASNWRGSLLKTLNDHFHPTGIEWDLAVTHQEGDGAKAAKRAVGDGVDLVAVFGGDGTLMDVCTGLAGSDVPMLILAGGTGNLIATELKISKSIEKALSGVVETESYQTRSMDVGDMGDRLFMLRIGCGVETHALQEASRNLKGQFGKWAYAFAGLKAMRDMKTADYRITINDGHVIEDVGVACAVANAGSIGVGRLTLSPKIEVNDGKLDLIFVRKADVQGIWELMSMMLGISKKGYQELPGEPGRIDASHLVNHWSVEKVKIETDPVLDMQVDGNLLGQTPISVEVRPSALQVVI
jgi:diacylglycerol kinase (ATP)